MKENSRSVSDFIDQEYKEYALYVLHNRAIPNAIDGLKPVQRKILYTALARCKTEFLKTASLVGFTMADSNYHHGDASIASAVNLLTQNFVGSNNVEMFEGGGSFGNRLVPEAAAARYTKVHLNKQFLKYFDDFEILDQNHDPENPEPLCYLPKIPWVLVNGSEGIAVGFATTILPRDPKLLIDTTIEKLKTKKKFPYSHYKPFFRGFKGKIEYNQLENNWIVEGTFQRKSNSTITVTELPIGWTREKYIEKCLVDLEEKQIIRNYSDPDFDDNGNIVFEVQFYRNVNIEDDEKVIKYLKLRTKLSENVNVIDNENHLRNFNNIDELVDYFIEYRVKKYQQRIERLLALSHQIIEFIDEKIRFIDSIISGKLKITELNKVQLKDQLKKDNYKFIDDLLELKIYKFTKDEIEHSLKTKEEHQKTIEDLLKTTPIEIYIKDLKQKER